MMKILILSLLLVSCSGGRNSTGYSIINDMMHSQALEAFAPSKHFENGQAMQAAPAGTIARGWMPGDLGEDGTLKIMRNPMSEDGRSTSAMSAYQWKRGKYLFEQNCAACHGVQGYANGLVVTKGGYPAPTAFAAPKGAKRKIKRQARKWKKTDSETGEYTYPSGYVYKVITEGYGLMKSHAQQLYPEDRWLVAEYVREFLMQGGKYHGRDMQEVLGE